MAKTKLDYDLIVLGSGAAGSVAAEIAAGAMKNSGRKVALIEAERLGGSAPNLTDVPVGALLEAAHTYDSAQRGAAFGLRTATLGYNFPSIQAWKDKAVRRSGATATGEYLQARGVTVLRGRAHFLSRNEISIGRRHLSAEKFIIATGSHSVIPDIPGLGKINYLTPETAIDLLRPPKSLAIIGAGATGVQFAELFAIFGSKVHLFESKKRILSQADDEVSSALSDVFSHQRGMEVHTSARVIAVSGDGGTGVRLKYLQGETERSVRVERVLTAVGSAPNTDIGLENADVQYDESGVKVDDFLTTNSPNIFAAGAVLGHRFGSTQSAIYQARVAAHNLTAKVKIPAVYDAMPSVIWTTPEIATVGLTESDLTRHDAKFHRSVVQNSSVARANISNFTLGFAKVLTDQKGVLLGATVMAPSAAETIGELSLAIQHRMSVQQIAETIHPFGSWSEVVRLACAKVRLKV